MGPTVFWPYSQELERTNIEGTGEITGPRLRVWQTGLNVNGLPGDHFSGEANAFRGQINVPWLGPVAPTPESYLPFCDFTNLPIGGIEWNGHSETLVPPPAIGDGGADWDGAATMSVPPPELGDGGIEWDGHLVVPSIGVDAGDGGAEWDGAATMSVPPPELGFGGIEWNGSGGLTSGTPDVGEGGIEWNGSGGLTSGTPDIGEGGIEWNGSGGLTSGTPDVGEGGIEWNG